MNLDRREFLNAVGTASLIGGISEPGKPRAVPLNPSALGFNLIPTADELAGQWMSFGNIHTLPALASTRGACQVGPDMLSIEALTFPPYCQGGSTGRLTIDGQPVNAAEFRWFPHQIQRRAVSWLGGIECKSTVRISSRGRIILFRLAIRNPSPRTHEISLDCPLQGMIRRVEDGWAWFIPRPENASDFEASAMDGGSMIQINDRLSDALTVFAFCGRKPDAILIKAHDGSAHWKMRLSPHGSLNIEMLLCVGNRHEPVAHIARRTAANFDTAFEACRTDWQDLFTAAFEPGNKIFSGHLPILDTPDPAIRRIYYSSVASLLVMMRGCFNTAHQAYVTGSPQCAASLMYFWDTFTWAGVHAMLDPVNMKNMLRRWLQLNIHNCYAQDMITGKGVGPWYSFNDYSVFSQFLTYIKTTGDTAFLNEVIGGRSVIDQLEQMATWWKRLVRPGSSMANYGSAWNLLECVPTYTHIVASLNAANVWMMRQMADLRGVLRENARAETLRSQADRLSREVLTLYVGGKGYWYSLHPGNIKIPVRHCIDFFTVARCMEKDLQPVIRTEMADFVHKQLLTQHWMRALSLQDVAAPESNRPDHGPMGAYDAWPPFTMDGLCRLGHFELAADFLRRTEGVTREGPLGQSHELLTTTYDSPVRKARRGGQMYNCSCSGAFAEVIIRTFFGADFDWQGNLSIFQPATDRTITGTLRNVPEHGKLKNIVSGPHGLSKT